MRHAASGLRWSWALAPVLFLLLVPSRALTPASAGEGPALGEDRITQAEIAAAALSLTEVRRKGRAIFSTPFNKLDGFGDGPVSAHDPISPGGRPTLQGSGTFLRVNGLDAQSCLECHFVLSAAEVPFSVGVGGLAGSSASVISRPTFIDVRNPVGPEGFNGRFINPPFLFGAGGVELLAKEMTADLQALKDVARRSPGQDVPLITKGGGVSFGVVRYENGGFDTSRVEGIDPDLVVRPFGRKGAFTTARAFDLGALPFHFGMQPVEVVGENADGDGDGVVNEVLIGEVSALSIFITTLERPDTDRLGAMGRGGAALFGSLGCAACHIPFLTTNSRFLTYSFPEVPTDPYANVYYDVDLTDHPTGFARASTGGVIVPLFADLKRHDMGPELAESFGSPLDSQFTTARLWGVADSAPYLHDSRALTLTDAILMHGGEARTARDAFAALADDERDKVVRFLRSLRTPSAVGEDLEEQPGRREEYLGGR